MAKFRPKLFGLTISPERLHQVRTERRPNSKYASFDNCVYEIDAAMKLMRVNGIRAFDSTKKSIEEIAAIIMQEARLDGNSY